MKTQNKTKLSLHMFHKVHYGIQAFKTGFKHFKTLLNEQKRKSFKSTEAGFSAFEVFSDVPFRSFLSVLQCLEQVLNACNR